MRKHRVKLKERLERWQGWIGEGEWTIRLCFQRLHPLGFGRAPVKSEGYWPLWDAAGERMGSQSSCAQQLQPCNPNLLLSFSSSAGRSPYSQPWPQQVRAADLRGKNPDVGQLHGWEHPGPFSWGPLLRTLPQNTHNSINLPIYRMLHWSLTGGDFPFINPVNAQGLDVAQVT